MASYGFSCHGFRQLSLLDDYLFMGRVCHCSNHHNSTWWIILEILAFFVFKIWKKNLALLACANWEGLPRSAVSSGQRHWLPWQCICQQSVERPLLLTPHPSLLISSRAAVSQMSNLPSYWVGVDTRAGRRKATYASQGALACINIFFLHYSSCLYTSL